jgi:hypothetical protein
MTSTLAEGSGFHGQKICSRHLFVPRGVLERICDMNIHCPPSLSFCAAGVLPSFGFYFHGVG